MTSCSKTDMQFNFFLHRVICIFLYFYFSYKRALDEGRKIAMRNYWVLACGVGSILCLMYLSYGFAFYFGSGLVVDGFCQPGSIFTVSQ